MNKLCGIYARISDPKDANIQGNSVETQISRLQEYIRFRARDPKSEAKWKLIDIYADEGKSGKNTDRPQLQRLLADIKTGRVNTVLCVKLDRITRSLLDFYNNLNVIFSQYQTEFISLTENFDTSTPMGKAMLSMTLVWAELEREQTSQRTKEKMRWLAEEGRWHGGHVLGYDLIEKKLVINKQEARIVNLIFNKYLEKGSVLKVVEFLNEHGYRTKEYISKRKGIKKGGAKFYNQNVLHILTNRLYLGEIQQKGKLYQGQHKGIVAKKLWHDVNQRLKIQAPKRSNPKREVKHVFVLQGLLKCDWCGNYMSTKYSSGRNGLCYYYQCTRNANSGKKGCEMKYVPAPQLEQLVLGELKKISADKRRIQRIIDEANKGTASVLDNLKKDRSRQEIKRTGIKTKIKNITHNIATHKQLKDSKSIAEELRDLETQLEQIEKDIQNIDFEVGKVQEQTMSARVVYESLTRFSQIYDAANPLEIKELLPLFVEKVIWNPSEIKIALFEQETQRGQLLPTSNQSSAGALEVKEWLPGYKRETKIYQITFLIADCPNRVTKRYLFVQEFKDFQEREFCSDQPMKRYVNPLRKALRWKAALDRESDLNNALLAKRLGTSRVRVTQYLNLLRLPAWAQKKLLEARGITEHTLRPLVQIQNEHVFKAAFQAILDQSMSPQTGAKLATPSLS